MTWEELQEHFKQLWPEMVSRLAKRSELSDEFLKKASCSCLIGNCLCGHDPANRCPCGVWRGTWRDNWRKRPRWFDQARICEPLCPYCGRPGWCET